MNKDCKNPVKLENSMFKHSKQHTYDRSVGSGTVLVIILVVVLVTKKTFV